MSARTAATSVRSRLATTLAVVLIGPMLVGAVAIGALAPRAARGAAQDAAGRDARSAQLALAGKCEAIGDAATAMAREVAGYATKYGAIPQVAADAAARNATRHRPEAAVAVLDPTARVLAVAGTPTGRIPAAAGGYGASCSAGLPGEAPGVAGLAEQRSVNTVQRGWLGTVVVWVPLDDAALRALRASLGTSGQLSLFSAEARPLASSLPRAEAARNVRTASAAASARRASSGVSDGLGYAIRNGGPGVPFDLLATSPVRGIGLLHSLAIALLALALLALVPIRVLAGRLSRPLADELLTTTGQLHISRVALADTFTRFGQALQHTHDLDKLLDIVAATCVQGTDAIAGLALLVDDGPDGQQTLEPRGSARRELAASNSESSNPEPPNSESSNHDPSNQGPSNHDPVDRAAAELPGFADRYFRGLSAGTTPEPEFVRLPGAGPALAVPLHSAGQVVGVLVLARGEGARAFDALALTRVRTFADHAGTAIANVRLHEEARRLSVTDPLTGVGNVRQLSTTLSREVERANRFDRPLTVLMLDLDHFKLVNDTLGHPFGDLVLREFARRLMACVREVDVVARYGGEEFAVVLPETDVEGGGRVAERVIHAVRAEPFRQGELRHLVTVSIGVAAFPRHGRSAAEVLQAADNALYVAKRTGRDRWEVAGNSPTSSAVSQAG